VNRSHLLLLQVTGNVGEFLLSGKQSPKPYCLHMNNYIRFLLGTGRHCRYHCDFWLYALQNELSLSSSSLLLFGVVVMSDRVVRRACYVFDRKIEIVQFASRTRQLFIRLLALVKWMNSASKVNKCGVRCHYDDVNGSSCDNGRHGNDWYLWH